MLPVVDTEMLNLKELLVNEDKLKADYEKKIKAKDEKRAK